ncbi:hypothetical protein N7533_011210 [Penicillium manginii]|uniref:uncharacterized protein n=1 Tax=Penicillium manginii TaxID=203109 RepID=UPI0025495653|nr:uncharacterized protein N7533_011210 [Penicillium manginii]KAJ5741801.1 hypothetical protein N7533_011210 [Penicillium manginii]
MTSVDTKGRPVPSRHFSSFSSTGIALEASDYPARTTWTFDAERFALRMAQSTSTALQTPRADPTPMNPNFDDYQPNNFNTGTCPRNRQEVFHETANIPMAELTSPMAASPLDLEMHASSSLSNPGLDPAPETQAQHQSPNNQYNVMGTTPTHTCPDPMNINGGLPPNQFDFIFFDRMLLDPRITHRVHKRSPPIPRFPRDNDPQYGRRKPPTANILDPAAARGGNTGQ